MLLPELIGREDPKSEKPKVALSRITAEDRQARRKEALWGVKADELCSRALPKRLDLRLEARHETLKWPFSSSVASESA